MTDTLYIIGNGFDLHHGIPSAYSNFGRYLAERDRPTAELVERYFCVDRDFWSEFEERLASFDSDTLVEDAAQFLVPYSADDWSDAYHHDYQYELGRVVSAVSETMRARFAEWIRQLPIPDLSTIGAVRLHVEPTATFLNFNYTPSLQCLYVVPDTQIFHIHGAATDPDAALILGHGWEPENLDPYRFESDPEGADMRVIEGIQLVDKYFKDTFKPTERILHDNRAFFEGLNGTRQIRVMGHSLSDVDYPYFREIIRNVDTTRARWMVSYHGDLSQTRDRFNALEINPELVEFALLSAF